MSDGEDAVRRRSVLADYRKKLLHHKELDSRVRSGPFVLFVLFSLLLVREIGNGVS